PYSARANPFWSWLLLNIAARSKHPGGANSLMADGHVRYVKDTVNVLVWQGLGSRNGSEVISGDAYEHRRCRIEVRPLTRVQPRPGGGPPWPRKWLNSRPLLTPMSPFPSSYSCHNVLAKSHRSKPRIDSPSFGASVHPNWQPRNADK